MAKIDKLLKSASEHLEQGEEIIASVMGAYETKLMGNDTIKNGIFIASDRRLIFYGSKMFGGYDMEVFPYQNISSIEMGKGLMGHSVTFFTSGNKATMKWINGGDVPKFIEFVKSKIGKKHEPTSGSIDVVDQIKKLADLKDSGIITEDEFQAKKTQLLSKL